MIALILRYYTSLYDERFVFYDDWRKLADTGKLPIWPHQPPVEKPRRLFVAPLSEEKNDFFSKLTYIGTKKSPHT